MCERKMGIRTLKRQLDSAPFLGFQYGIIINNVHYRVDLVFYHWILRYFAMIDLKKNFAQHEDIGHENGRCFGACFDFLAFTS